MPLHFLKRYSVEILVIFILLVVLTGSMWLLWLSYGFEEDFALTAGHMRMAAAGNFTADILDAGRAYLPEEEMHSLRLIMQTGSILIIALFSLCAVLFWYSMRNGTLLARAASIRKKSHDRYRFLTEGPPTIGIVRFSLVDFRLLDCNRAALNITGMPRAEFIGRTLTDFIDSRDTGIATLELQELRGGRSSHEFTVKMLQYHGGIRLITWHISVLKLIDDEPQAVAILTDVSKEHEVRIERMERERLAGVLQMAGAAAHELNQPMQVVSGLLWMLLNKMDKDDPAHKTLETIYSEVERMTVMSRKIAGISSYEVKDYVGETKIIDIDRATGAAARKKNMPRSR